MEPPLKPFKQVWDENPFTSSLKDYSPNEIIVETLNSHDKLSIKVYSEIKCLILDIYRGVCCWMEFGKHIKKCFPNLEMLFVHQAYTYCQEPSHFLNFMNDPWLKKIFICTIKDTYPFESTPTRILHDFNCCNVCNKFNKPIYHCEYRWLQYNIFKLVESSSIQLQDDDSDFSLTQSQCYTCDHGNNTGSGPQCPHC